MLFIFFVILFCHCESEFDKQFDLNKITKIEYPPYYEVHRMIKKYKRTGDYSVIIRYNVNEENMKSLLNRLKKEVNSPDSEWIKDVKKYIYEQEIDDYKYFRIVIYEFSENYFEVEYGRQKYPSFKYFKHKNN